MIARSLTPRVVEALSDTRVVVVLGARQVGKSTLVGEIARADLGAEVLTLDDAATREAAASDPSGFIIDRATPLVIDEVQRVPDVLLAIKARVDRDPRPGQYLLTGSANILTAPRIADALTGRAEYLRLGPFTQSELHGAGATFVTDVLDGRWPAVTQTSPGRRAYAELLATGGYPEARERNETRRARFFASYLDTIIQRDLSSIARVHDQENVRRLLSAIAATSASLMNVDSLARDLALPSSTVRSHVSLLETLFLTARLEAWSTNLLKPHHQNAEGLHRRQWSALPSDRRRVGTANRRRERLRRRVRDVRHDGASPPGSLARGPSTVVPFPRSRQTRGRRRHRAARRLDRGGRGQGGCIGQCLGLPRTRTSTGQARPALQGRDRAVRG